MLFSYFLNQNIDNNVHSDIVLDEIKLEVEQTTLKFIDLARQMETFFLQKRFLLSSSKPELLLKEENVDLRHEIARKDELIKKHLQKIGKWKEYLADISTPGRPAMPPGAGIPQAGLSDTPPPLMTAQRHPGQQPMIPQQMMQANNPGIFMNVPRPGFPGPGPIGGPMGGPSMQNMAGNPLAFLEKTTNNIDMGGPTQR
jgi:hypothetical protein